MKLPTLLQLLGTLAMAPVFAISYALHAHADPPGSHAGRVSHQTATSSIAAQRRSSPVQQRTVRDPHPGVWVNRRTASIARAPSLHGSRAYDTGQH